MSKPSGRPYYFFLVEYDINILYVSFQTFKSLEKLIITGHKAVSPGSLCYLATKGAIEQIARVLAKELGPRGIKVNTVSPGQLDAALFRETNKTPGIMDSLVKQNSSRRHGGPEDIAPIVAFLASEAAQWINGQNIQVDGVSKK